VPPAALVWLAAPTGVAVAAEARYHGDNTKNRGFRGPILHANIKTLTTRYRSYFSPDKRTDAF
jgi:hypothetical protein